MSTKILIVDDHKLIRQGIAQYLENSDFVIEGGKLQMESTHSNF